MEKDDKTGYEETKEKDTYNEIEKDEFPEIKKEEEIVEKDVEEKKETIDPEKKKDVSNLKKEEDEKLAEELSDSIEDEMNFDDEEEKKEESKEKEEGEESKEKEEKEEDSKEEEEKKDIFDTTDLEEQLSKKSKIKESTKGIDFQELANEIKVDDVDIKIEDNNIESFKKGIKNAIQEAKQKTEFNLTEYTDEQQDIIRFVTQNPVSELLNPLKEFDDVLLLGDEDKLKTYYENTLKMSKDDSEAKVENLIETDGLRDEVDKLDNLITNAREKTFNELIKISNNRANEFTTRENQRVKKEKQDMVDVVDGVKTFMGKKINDKVRNYLKMEINSGELSKSNNNASTQVKARLFDLFGSRIIKEIGERVKDSSREGYNTAKKKANDALHNNPPTTGAKNASKTKVAQEAVTGPLSGFEDIDSDAIDGRQ